MVHFTIGVPCLETMHVDSVNSLFSLTFNILKRGHTFTLRTHKGSLVDVARNKIANNFLESESDYLLFVDSDMVYPDNGWDMLLDSGKDIVAGLCFQKYRPYSPAMHSKLADGRYMPVLDYKKGDIIEVDSVGTAFLLIKRNVLEKLNETVTKANGVPQFFSFLNGKGEDINFCELAKAAGFSVWCNTGVLCDHLTTTPVGEKHFEMFRDRLREKKEG